VAILLALAALGAAGYVGWRQWQQEHRAAADSERLAALAQRAGVLEASLSDLGELRKRVDAADQAGNALREEAASLGSRTRSLEDIVAKLSERSLSGRDGALLDEAETLLRMARERYELFHDTAGAASAYALADQTLAAVDDAAYASVRQSLAAEREALARSRPAGQADAPAVLAGLRGEVGTLPLKPLDEREDGAEPGVWARIRHALAGVVSVRRDNGAPLAVADARFARELVALDLAQAEAAYLAHDEEAYAAALQRADAGLANQFDTAAPAVKQVRDELAKLAVLAKPAAVQLGAALAELRNLRAVHAVKPMIDAAQPAAAGSAPARPAAGGAR
jgi:uroporphyrin-3 C-methyltransferase